MAKDFALGLLQGLYNSGVGNPAVQSEEAKTKMAFDLEKKKMALEAAKEGLKPTSATGNQFGSGDPIWNLFRNAMFPGSSDQQSISTSFQPDSSRGQYYQDTKGTVGVTRPGEQIPSDASRLSPSQGPNLLSSQARQLNKPQMKTTTIWQDPKTGNVSGESKDGWIARAVPETTASRLLLTNYNQDQNRSKPTNTTRASAEFAKTIIPHIDDMRQLIQQADQAGYIGPGAGRIYGEFLAGKVGSTGDDNADMLLGRLRTVDSLMKTGAMRVHFGARGGQQMYDHFSDMLNTGKQSAAMLNGSLDEIESFMTGYANAGNVKGSRDNSEPLNPTKKPSSGMNNLSQQDREAIDWAKKNPLNPDAQAILKLHGL